jgi:branched-subunit amino acid transport protein
VSDTLSLWLAIAGIALTGVVTRCSFLLLSERLRLSATLERALRYAPAAALSAIVLPILVIDHQGGVAIGWSNHEWIASAVAALSCGVRAVWLGRWVWDLPHSRRCACLANQRTTR